MSRIRGRDTRPEVRVRKALWHAGYRYRLRSDLPGSPDLVFARARLAVFIDGCFWHGCPIHYSAPSTRYEFWSAKLRRNVEHDLDVDDSLGGLGWRCFHVWQHELSDIDDLLGRFAKLLTQDDAKEDLSVAGWLAEPTVGYDPQPASPWYRCPCGTEDVRVLAVSEPGSLRPKAKKKPPWVELACTKCRGIFGRAPRGTTVGTG